MKTDIPLALYIHIPWCVKKCPYCDFNSHRAGSVLPEVLYVDQLIKDLKQSQVFAASRSVQSIFIGGGTPSLFSSSAIAMLLERVKSEITVSADAEITMEANPGTAEQAKFDGFREAGVNRLSIGVQSFQDEKLRALGRIHGADEAKKAVQIARQAGFDNINIDLMHGLPHQVKRDALFDLQTSIDLQPEHLSWYQLTLEPNTVFAKHPPMLPQDETLWDIQEAGEKLLAEQGYRHYEISAYAKNNQQCRHNINYWQFGDYLAIGAGAHGKITQDKQVIRYWQHRNPRDYLNAENFTSGEKIIAPAELPLEFMMNALRLIDGVPATLFLARTGLDLSVINQSLSELKQKELLVDEVGVLKTTVQGQRFLNDCLSVF